MTTLKNYFNSVAKNYTKRNNFFPLRIIKNHEYNIFINLLNKKKFFNSIELGCGSGFYTNFIRRITKNKLYVVDISKRMLDQIKDNSIIKINKKIENLKINCKFDLVVIAGVIEFMGNSKKLFKKINLMTKKNSTLLILLPKKNFFNYLYYFYYLIKNIKIKLHATADLLNYLKINNFHIKYKINSIFSVLYLCYKNEN
jgi:ubiquinone/menaquinone biosynthesis C-methylase UbiE